MSANIIDLLRRVRESQGPSSEGPLRPILRWVIPGVCGAGLLVGVLTFVTPARDFFLERIGQQPPPRTTTELRTEMIPVPTDARIIPVASSPVTVTQAAQADLPPAAPANTQLVPVPPGEPVRAPTRWVEVVADERLRQALGVAYTYSPQWRPLADQAATRPPRIVWGDIPAEVSPTAAAVYNQAAHTITVSPTLRNESLAVIAAVIAHESYHALAGTGGETSCRLGASACIREEVNAFSWTALVYTQSPDATKTATNGQFGQSLEQLVRVWRNRGLVELVMAQPNYRRMVSTEVTSP